VAFSSTSTTHQLINQIIMRILWIITTVVILFSCTGNDRNHEAKVNKPREISAPGFQTIIDSAGVAGSILVYDLKGDCYYSNDFIWSRIGHLPASTFKIVNSIIALETNTVENDSTLFKWNGAKRRLKDWEQDLIFRDAFHYSCVPCYQDIARRIGVTAMIEYLDKLDYGNIQVDSANIDLFWLEGESQISQFQQIDFLTRFHQSKLPISTRTENIMKRLMVIETTDEYTLSGKTGWSIRNGNNNGWYVGYVETPDNTWFFATNVEPEQEFNMEMFPMIRKEITSKALKQLKIIP